MCMDYDGPEFSHDTTPCAKKEYKCCECYRMISIGEKYGKTRGVWDGQFITFKTCEHCLVARNWIQDECGGYVYGMLLEDLREHRDNSYDDTADPKLRRYIALLPRKWKINGQLISIERLNTYRKKEVLV